MQPARLRVRVHPGARRDELEGWRNGVLHAGVSGPEPGAAANAALIALVAERLDVTPAQVTILFGEQDRLKELAVDGLDQASAEARLDAPGPADRCPPRPGRAPRRSRRSRWPS